jgi:hypothetical protein
MTEISGIGKRVYMVLLCQPFSRKEILLEQFSQAIFTLVKDVVCGVLFLRVKIKCKLTQLV